MPISKLLPNVNSSKLLGRVNIFSAPITKLEIKIKNNDIKPDRLANLHSKTKFYDMKPDRLANLQNKYYYFMGRGNNSQVVDEVMSKRIWWIKEENVTGKNINFIWQQHSKGIPWERFSDKHPNEIPIVFNHFEFIYEIGTKNLLMKNLIEYCSIHDIYVYNFVPLTMEIKLEENLEIDLKLFHKIHTHIRHQKCGNVIDFKNFLKDVVDPKVKARLLDRLKTSMLEPLKKIPGTYNKGPCAWFLKPTNCNRGNGIEVFNSTTQLQKLIYKVMDLNRQKLFGFPSLNANKTTKGVPKFIVQKYCEDLMLIGTRKFDIRVLV